MAYIRKGLSIEGDLSFKIDWASLIVGSKFTVSALSYFTFNLGAISKYKLPRPGRGAYIWRGNLTEGFFASPVWGGGLIFGGAYFRNFTVLALNNDHLFHSQTLTSFNS